MFLTVPSIESSQENVFNGEGFANEWTVSITSQSITQNSGVTVTQGSVTGVLKTALTGTTTSIVIQSNFDVVFVDDVDLVIGSSPAVAHSTITAATNSGTTTTVAACNTQVQILFPDSVTTTKIRLVSKKSKKRRCSAKCSL